MLRRQWKQWLGCVAILSVLAIPAVGWASPGSLSGSLTVFLGDGSDSDFFIGTPGNLRSYFGGSFYSAAINQPLLPVAVGPGLISGAQFVPVATGSGGTVPLPTLPNSLYVL